MLINQKAKGKIPEDNQEFLLEMKTNGLQSRGMMVRQVVVVVCSSSNSNNGEKVDICSSKNELSSKKNFFLIFCTDLFCSFFYLFFGDALICFFCFLRMDFSRQMIWPNFVSFVLIFFIQSSSARQDNIVLIFQQYQAKWGFVFKRECASQILRHRAAGHFCLSSEVDGIAHNKTVITILQRLLFMNGFMQQQ